MTSWRFPSPSSSQPILPGLFSSLPKHRIFSPHDQALSQAKTRLGVVFFLFSLAWVVITGRLAYLTIGHRPSPSPEIVQADEKLIKRADITDRNGVILATSLPTVSLCSDSNDILDVDDAARKLMSVLPTLNRDKLKKTLADGRHCSTVYRHLTPTQYYDVNKLGIVGIHFLSDERRLYPVGNLAAHVIGFSDIDDRGLAGIERSADERLGEQSHPLVLSLDVRVQSVLREKLASSMRNFRAEAATGLVMNIGTGEILGMVSLPDFDPSHAGNASAKQRFNRTTLGVYEMGSTFKIFNTALALESGKIRLTDTFNTMEPLKIGHYTIRDFEKEKRNLNVAEIFTHSSNIGSARMAERLGGAKQRAFFERLGLTQKVSLEIPEVGTPLLPSEKDWSDVTTLTASFGHGIAVNAVQLAAAVATIVNNGHPVHPTLLKRNESFEPDVDTVISPHTSALIRGLMRLVVTHGTAKRADVEGYLVGGKTGTADKLNRKHQYSKDERRSSFIGVFPINAPQYLVFALLDNPKGNKQTKGFATAGWVVAPTVSAIITQIAPLLGLPPLPEKLGQTAERQVLKPLGPFVLARMDKDKKKDYAASESDSLSE
ncbi:MAG: penicillin-binding protein 2 [Alphaproteobacteria bacterium]|nr:penicillin-binding protein 2 [Alphaproteobacteria bacterium]